MTLNLLKEKHLFGVEFMSSEGARIQNGLIPKKKKKKQCVYTPNSGIPRSANSKLP